jgi:fructokinase
MPQVISLGEVLADFVPRGCGYVLRPGGAPSNVAVNLSRMGVSAGIIGKVGGDFIGSYLRSFLKSNKVDISNLITAGEKKTGLVFVSPAKKGGRDFTFYGEPSADKFLSAGEIDRKYIKMCGIFHYGSISFMHPVSAKATLKAITTAKKCGKLISFDPNFRCNLWQGRFEQAVRTIKGYFKYADIIKISDSELNILFNAKPSAKSLTKIFRPDQLVFVSAGAKGCYVHYNGYFKYIKGFKVKVIDTTGAGDAFMAGALCKIIKFNKKLSLSNENLYDIAVYANKMGSKAVTRKGAV